MNISTISKRFAALVTVVAVSMTGSVIFSSPASAHATVQTYGVSATAGGYGHAFIRIPHAEAGKSTVRIDVQIPAGVTSVKPQQVAGWNESIELAADGKTAAKVIWSGGNLPNTSFADFGISLKYPATPGETLYFKTVQTLNDGTTISWVEIPAAGQDSHSLAKPAPSVKLPAAAATDGHNTTPSTGGHSTTPTTGGHSTTPTTGGHTDGASTEMMTWQGDVIAKFGSSKTKLIADTSATRAGDKASVVLVKNGKEIVLAAVSLDSRGDLVRTVATKKTGKGAYTIAKGDTIALMVAGKKVAQAIVA